MPKPIKQPKRPMNMNQLAHHLVGVSTSEKNDTLPPTKAQISMLMAELGRKGGKIGGKRRLVTLSAERRREIAKKAAEARWRAKEKQ